MNDYKVAKVATNWWIHQMKKRCKELYPNKVTDDGFNLVVVDISLEHELSRFQDALFKQILHHIQRKHHLSLTCYYWPTGELKVLVRNTSIPEEYFPQRANMQIYDGCVKVSINGEDLHNLPLTTT